MEIPDEIEGVGFGFDTRCQIRQIAISFNHLQFKTGVPNGPLFVSAQRKVSIDVADLIKIKRSNSLYGK